MGSGEEIGKLRMGKRLFRTATYTGTAAEEM